MRSFIYIQYVREVFGDQLQHWNVEYDKAVEIFQEGSYRSGIIRSILSSINRNLLSADTTSSSLLSVQGGQYSIRMNSSLYLMNYISYSYLLLISRRSRVSDLIEIWVQQEEPENETLHLRHL